ncbi:MAG: hypothetical protein WB780_12110 [Candidatus Acidiferrales bacterium]
MHKDERDLLDVLKFELSFLEKGGYGRSPREPWRPILMFEDSPTCMNYDSKENPDPCDECVLMQLVPQEFRQLRVPCRHIPLNAAGETLDTLYRYADQYETEKTYGDWLRTTIAKLEEERQSHHDDPQSPPAAGVTKGEPLYHNQKPKCANPACPTTFHWVGGGKFFRFRVHPASSQAGAPDAQVAGGPHNVKHYWLCERCSHIFTLVFDEKDGVVLTLPELPIGHAPNQSTAA